MDNKVVMKDRLIMRFLRKHDERGLGLLLEEYGTTIKSVVFYHLRCLPIEDREECIEDTLIEVWNNHAAFDEKKGNLKNWICGVAKYNALDYLRKYIKYAETESIYEYDNLEDVRSEYMFMRQELEGEISQLLSVLSEAEKELVKKHYIEGYSVKEIAGMYSTGESAIYKKLERAIKKIRKLKKVE